VAGSGLTAPQAAGNLKEWGILVHAFSKTMIRLVTHLDVSREDIAKALEAFRRVFR
jgi:threonine aldolase